LFDGITIFKRNHNLSCDSKAGKGARGPQKLMREATLVTQGMAGTRRCVLSGIGVQSALVGTVTAHVGYLFHSRRIEAFRNWNGQLQMDQVGQKTDQRRQKGLLMQVLTISVLGRRELNEIHSITYETLGARFALVL